METTDNIAIKTALARLLATENIDVRIDNKASTATFDMKSRVLRLPHWKDISNELYDMLLVHEVGHALDTPHLELVLAHDVVARKGLGSVSTFARKTAHDYINVVEDARIDKRQMRRYPGARRDYTLGYDELQGRGFLGILSDKALAKRNFIDRFNIYFKGGRLLGIKFTAAEMAFIKEAEALETWTQVVDLASRMLAFAAAEHNKPKKPKADKSLPMPKPEPKETDPEAGDNEDEPGEMPTDDADDADETDGAGDEESSETSEDEAEEDGNGSDADGNVEDDAEEGSEEGDDDSETDKAAGTGASEEDDKSTLEDAIKSETAKAFEESVEKLASTGGPTLDYIDLPKFDMGVGVTDYPKVMADYDTFTGVPGAFNSKAEFREKMESSFQTWKMGEKTSIGYMISQFEMRKAADEYARTSQARTGIIDLRKLHSYKYSDDIFLQETVVSDGKSHGFVMIVDWSASMTMNLNKTVKQLLALVMFCEQTQIPFEVYSFRDALGSAGPLNEMAEPFPTFQPIKSGYYSQSYTESHLSIGNFRLRNLLSSRMGRVKLNTAMVNLWSMSLYPYVNKAESLSGTPLQAAILGAADVINAFKLRTGVQIVNAIVLTDGDSSNITPVLTSGHVSSQSVVYYTDPKTKKKYKYNSDWRVDQTKQHLEILKDRTGCNLVGFFLAGDGGSPGPTTLQKKFFPGKEADPIWAEARKSWKDNAFMSVKDRGYDSYFVIDGYGRYVGKESGVAMVEKKTAKQLSNDLMKTNKIKMQNRTLLQKYISLVAS